MQILDNIFRKYVVPKYFTLLSPVLKYLIKNTKKHSDEKRETLKIFGFGKPTKFENMQIKKIKFQEMGKSENVSLKKNLK